MTNSTSVTGNVVLTPDTNIASELVEELKSDLTVKGWSLS